MTVNELDLEPCPGCDRKIDCTLTTCPHCKYDLMKMQPAQAPKAPKPPKAKKPLKNEKMPKIIEQFQINPSSHHEEEAEEREIEVERDQPGRGKSCIMVPALGRAGRPSIDFPELHWSAGDEPTDKNLLHWGLMLRDAWPRGSGDKNSWLSNHAIFYLAGQADGKHDAVLNENAHRIMTLLGGDDW